MLLLLLLLLARRRRDDEPVTVEENDSVVVAPNQQGQAGAGQGGQAYVQRNISAVDPRTGQRTPIAEEITTVDEDLVDPNNPNNPNNPQQGGRQP